MAGKGAMGCKIYMTMDGNQTAIVHAEKISFPELEKILSKCTAHDSPEGFDEYADSGNRKLGAITLALRWDIGEPTHAFLLAAVTSPDDVVFKAEDPDGEDSITFNGQVQKIGRVTEQEKHLQANITIQPTGAPS
jgi:hypothetical protein